MPWVADACYRRPVLQLTARKGVFAVFYMVNKEGNCHQITASEKRRDRLIALGFHEVKKQEVPKPAKRKKAVADNEGD